MSKELNWDDWADQDRAYAYEVWKENPMTKRWGLVIQTDRKDRAMSAVDDDQGGNFSIEEITYLDNQVEHTEEIYRRTK